MKTEIDKAEFVTCHCRKVDVTGDKFKTYIGKECKCVVSKGEKTEEFYSQEGILTTLP